MTYVKLLFADHQCSIDQIDSISIHIFCVSECINGETISFKHPTAKMTADLGAMDAKAVNDCSEVGHKYATNLKPINCPLLSRQ
jgi:hypothetical protein